MQSAQSGCDHCCAASSRPTLIKVPTLFSAKTSFRQWVSSELASSPSLSRRIRAKHSCKKQQSTFMQLWKHSLLCSLMERWCSMLGLNTGNDEHRGLNESSSRKTDFKKKKKLRFFCKSVTCCGCSCASKDKQDSCELWAGASAAAQGPHLDQTLPAVQRVTEVLQEEAVSSILRREEEVVFNTWNSDQQKSILQQKTLQ